ncbi:DUF2922 family protein [Lacticaseibacillus paracasei]|jgi:hypothetical protein|uniref:DUF2922 domain-containing protein n=1 Tax=Lacticaseibacillus paracasei TaxID=1597 RepID=A0ABD7BV61_LACPA|nr:DUF2922 family protein [Lacticaseibacillus paracasei]QOP56532.1 DUF2922 domain-containing protein [Lacticaseibacillus paracasei]
MEQTLVVSFKTGDGKTASVRFQDVPADISEATASQFMDKLHGITDQFVKAGIQQYVTHVAAKIVQTETKDLYTNEGLAE